MLSVLSKVSFDPDNSIDGFFIFVRMEGVEHVLPVTRGDLLLIRCFTDISTSLQTLLQRDRFIRFTNVA